ncbi:hypothetical protein P886_1276 [Alteromonadaceae bacterium 2753L.S.0a.02]|nr:hypothetical protein P886_1276 [Alteromonadaceae bacterium 2753L.S.0a.02]
MRYAKFLIAVSLVGCVEQESFLEGEWRSNKELTIAALETNEILSKKHREILETELGKLTLVFRGSKAAIYFKDESSKKNKLEWMSYEVSNVTNESFTVEFKQGIFSVYKMSYKWDGACFYLVSPDWNFDEYFCRL